MKRFALFILSGLCFTISFAQDDNTFIKQGLLKATATISPAFMLQQSVENIYINGESEYFIENRISVRGDLYWFLGSQKKPSLLNQNSFIVSGALYHFPKRNLDYFIGFQPGISFVQPNIIYVHAGPGTLINWVDIPSPSKVCPTISAITGITYYVGDYFNFFLNIRYTKARYFGGGQDVLNLDQLIISGGLGFDIDTKKFSSNSHRPPASAPKFN